VVQPVAYPSQGHLRLPLPFFIGSHSPITGQNRNKRDIIRNKDYLITYESICIYSGGAEGMRNYTHLCDNEVLRFRT